MSNQQRPTERALRVWAEGGGVVLSLHHDGRRIFAELLTEDEAADLADEIQTAIHRLRWKTCPVETCGQFIKPDQGHVCEEQGEEFSAARIPDAITDELFTELALHDNGEVDCA